MTILVESPIERERYPEIAGYLMRYESLHAEQTGFIERPAPQDSAAWARLQMAGGEFCGNATMGLATYLAWLKNTPDGTRVLVPLEVSGANELVECSVCPDGGAFFCTLRMPTPEKIVDIVLPVNGAEENFTAVVLPGITHVIVPVARFGLDPRTMAESVVQEWGMRICADAFGIILFDEEACRIDPLVSVKPLSGAGVSLVWERGCGSGSAAVGAYLAAKGRGNLISQVSQPGGILEVEARWKDETFSLLSITGTVRLVARGVAYI
jgi:diaminopimelate epimerase